MSLIVKPYDPQLLWQGTVSLQHTKGWTICVGINIQGAFSLSPRTFRPALSASLVLSANVTPRSLCW